MQLNITGQQINLGDNLRDYADTALTNTVSKYFEEAVSADIKVAKDGALIRTDIMVRPASGTVINASGTSADAYASFDDAVAKMARQLRKYKNKLVGHKAQKIEMVDMSVIDAEKDKEEVADAPIIIAEMQTALPVCTVSEAVMRMDLEGANALLFKNTAHGGLNMVYRRVDGNIGWVDPKNK